MILDSSGCCWEARKMLQPASRKNTPRWCPYGMIAASGLIIRWFRLASNWKCRLSLDVQWSKAATQWFVVAILKHNHLEWGSHGLAKTMISTASRRRYSNEDICRMVEGHGQCHRNRMMRRDYCEYAISPVTMNRRWMNCWGWSFSSVLRWRWHTSWHQLALTADRKAANRMQRGAHPNAIWTIGLSPTNGLYLY